MDRLGSTGLELMMTEFDLGWPDVLERADWFEDAIRAFFGHPKMKGVILWDFWNETMKEPDHDLVRGQMPNLEVCVLVSNRLVGLSVKACLFVGWLLNVPATG